VSIDSRLNPRRSQTLAEVLVAGVDCRRLVKQMRQQKLLIVKSEHDRVDDADHCAAARAVAAPGTEIVAVDFVDGNRPRLRLL